MRALRRGSRNRPGMRKSVVLPQPLGPSSAKNSPARISSETAVHPRGKSRTSSPRASIRNSGNVGRFQRPVRIFGSFARHISPPGPNRDRTLAADRPPLNRAAARSHNNIGRRLHAAVAMNAARGPRVPAGCMVRPSFERRHRMSSGKRAHSRGHEIAHFRSRQFRPEARAEIGRDP